jgi:crossover junction endodeoxyribonuclease RuvC
MKTIIGIDPGKSGGISWITDGKACAEKMPETLKDFWELILDITGISKHYTQPTDFKAYLEQVSAMPGQGVTSCFTFGNGFGHLEMALTAAGIPFERVSPQKWQKSLGCRTGGNKNISKAKAQELFPAIKCTHAISDSLLIAEYGRRQNL